MYCFSYVHFVPSCFFFSSSTIKASVSASGTVPPRGMLQSHNVALWRMCRAHVVPLGRPGPALCWSRPRIAVWSHLRRNVYSRVRYSSFQDFQKKRREGAAGTRRLRDIQQRRESTAGGGAQAKDRRRGPGGEESRPTVRGRTCISHTR